MQNESLGKSFYSLSFNFQTVSNFTQFHSSNHTTKQNYLFNITFQNLEFWDITNLPPLKWISSSRFGEARKKKVRVGVFSKSIDCQRGSGVLPPLEKTLRSHQFLYTPSYCWQCQSSQILWKFPSLGSSGSGITFTAILLSFHLGTVIPRLGLLSWRVWRQY